MRNGAGARYSDRSQGDSGGHEEAPCAYHRQIHFLIRGLESLCHFSLLVRWRSTRLKHRYGKVDRTLGGAASYFALAASHFTPVRVVAIVGNDFTEKERAVFRGRKIDLSGVEHAEGKSFFWAGRYSQNMNERTTLATELNVFANFKPTLPDSLSRFVLHIFLGNIDPTLQRSVLKQVNGKPKVVGLDTMNYWIEGTPMPNSARRSSTRRS